MLHANYFLVVDRTGHFIIGRTDGLECGFIPCKTPDGKQGMMTIAPANFVDVYRTEWIYKHQWGCHQLLDKETSLWLTRTAILAWIDHRKTKDIPRK